MMKVQLKDPYISRYVEVLFHLCGFECGFIFVPWLTFLEPKAYTPQPRAVFLKTGYSRYLACFCTCTMKSALRPSFFARSYVRLPSLVAYPFRRAERWFTSPLQPPCIGRDPCVINDLVLPLALNNLSSFSVLVTHFLVGFYILQ